MQETDPGKWWGEAASAPPSQHSSQRPASSVSALCQHPGQEALFFAALIEKAKPKTYTQHYSREPKGGSVPKCSSGNKQREAWCAHTGVRVRQESSPATHCDVDGCCTCSLTQESPTPDAAPTPSCRAARNREPLSAGHRVTSRGDAWALERRGGADSTTWWIGKCHQTACLNTAQGTRFMLRMFYRFFFFKKQCFK